MTDAYIIARATLNAAQREYRRLRLIGSRERAKAYWPRVQAANMACLAMEIKQ